MASQGRSGWSIAVTGRWTILVVDGIDSGRLLAASRTPTGLAGPADGDGNAGFPLIVVVAALEEIVTHSLRVHGPVVSHVELGAAERRVYVDPDAVVTRWHGDSQGMCHNFFE